MTADLTEFLLARVADDEAVAQLAMADDDGADEGLANQFAYLTGRQRPAFGGAVGPPRRPVRSRGVRGETADHRPTPHNPATKYVPEPGFCDCQCPDGIVEELWPCETMKVLAAVHADHPDYQESWRP